MAKKEIHIYNQGYTFFLSVNQGYTFFLSVKTKKKSVEKDGKRFCLQLVLES